MAEPADHKMIETWEEMAERYRDVAKAYEQLLADSEAERKQLLEQLEDWRRMYWGTFEQGD